MAPPTLTPELIQRFTRADERYGRFNSARSLRLEDGQLVVRRFGDAVAHRDSARPEPYYNRVTGFSEGELVELDAIIEFYHSQKLACRIEVTPNLLGPDVVGELGAREFRFADQATFFYGPTRTAAPSDRGVRVRRMQPDELEEAFDLIERSGGPEGDPISRAVRDRRREHYLEPRFPMFFGSIDGRAVALASTFFDDGVAFLGNAYTEPDYRGRGCQLALLEHRLHDAARSSCDVALTDARFGTTSHRNIERAGLRMAYARPAFELP